MPEILTYWFDPKVTTSIEMYLMEHAAIISAVYQDYKLFTAFATTNLKDGDHMLWMIPKN